MREPKFRAYRYGETSAVGLSVEDVNMYERLSNVVDDMIVNGIGIKLAVQEMETMYIQKILQKHNGNITLAAEQMNMHRNTLTRKIHHLAIHKINGAEA